MENNKPGLKNIVAVHIGLGAGVMVFLAVILYLNSQKMYAYYIPELITYYTYGCLALTVIMFIVAPTVFKMIIENAKSKYSNVKDKKYRIFLTAHIVRVALLEAAALFACFSLLQYSMEVGIFRVNIETILPMICLFIFFVSWIYFFPTESKVNNSLDRDG